MHKGPKNYLFRQWVLGVESDPNVRTVITNPGCVLEPQKTLVEYYNPSS
jgi:hypothetical protein